MLQAICIVFLIKIGGSVKAREDIFTAVADIEDLLDAQKRVKDYLHFYIERHEKRLAVLKSYLDIFKREHQKAIKYLYSYMSDPIHVFTLIKHLTVDVNSIKRSITDETGNIGSIMNNFNMWKYPTMADLRGAAIAIIRLQDIYALEVKDFSEGKLNSSTNSTPTPMTACDCFELGHALYQEKDFMNGLEWILEAFRKYNEEEIHYSVSAFTIIEHISFGYAKLGDLKLSVEWIQKILNQDPQNSRAKQIEQICYSSLEDERYKTKANCLKDKEAKQRQLKANVRGYYRLCRSRSVVPTQIANRLTCRYLTENHPFSKLAPFKIEMLSLNPDLVLFHEVLSDNEIETIKKMSKYKLKRSTINMSGNNSRRSDNRISKSAWFNDTDSETVARISHRIEQMTGLNLASAESMQVANYGIGGHYRLHHDCMSTGPMTYNRFATVLFYMSEVTQGGATVFPYLGISVFPIKGAAIFWINMHTSGEANLAMMHTACPVLQGSKWVFTKWIYEHGQAFIKPCDPEQHKKDQYKYFHTRMTTKFLNKY